MIHGDWIGRWARAYPGREALVDLATGRRYTYAQLSAEVNRLASYLASGPGLARGDRVACLALNRAEYIALFFAVSRLGAVLVPLNHRLAVGEFAYYLDDAAPRALFFDQANLGAARALAGHPGLERLACFDDDATLGDSLPALWPGLSPDPPPEIEIAPDDPQLIIYTSGTTGLPKGVVLTHRAISCNAINANLGWDLRAADRAICHPSLSYTAGWNVFTLPLFQCRGLNVLVSGFDPPQILDLIQREKITVFFGVPTMYRMLLDDPGFDSADFSSLRFLVSGGAPLDRELIDLYLDRKNLRIWEGYGLTEIGPNNFMANGKPGTLGTPMPLADVKLVDETGAEAPPGQDGEIWLRGPHCCAGYWNRPEETAQLIKDGWLRTGDLGRVDADGHYAIVGRKKDMFISGGINIYPAEIERRILEHPDVAGAAVIGVPDPKWGEAAKAVLELRPGRSLTLDDLRSFLDSRLGRFKLPKYLAVLPALPRTAASGKVQKFLIRRDHGGADNQ